MNMHSSELFGAAIRVVGLLSVVRGINDALYVVLYAVGSVDSSVSGKYPISTLIGAIVYLGCGLYLLRGAPALIEYAYPYRDDVIRDDQPQNEHETGNSEAVLAPDAGENDGI